MLYLNCPFCFDKRKDIKDKDQLVTRPSSAKEQRTVASLRFSIRIKQSEQTGLGSLRACLLAETATLLTLAAALNTVSSLGTPAS